MAAGGGGEQRQLATSGCRSLSEARLSTTDPYLFAGAEVEGFERLRRAGVADAYAMPAEGKEVTISLGLFSERQRALRRLDDAKAVGRAPRIVDRERTGTVYWIDVDVVPPAQLPDAARLQGEGGRILRLEVKPCESVGG